MDLQDICSETITTTVTIYGRPLKNACRNSYLKKNEVSQQKEKAYSTITLTLSTFSSFRNFQ